MEMDKVEAEMFAGRNKNYLHTPGEGQGGSYSMTMTALGSPRPDDDMPRMPEIGMGG